MALSPSRKFESRILHESAFSSPPVHHSTLTLPGQGRIPTDLHHRVRPESGGAARYPAL